MPGPSARAVTSKAFSPKRGARLCLKDQPQRVDRFCDGGFVQALFCFSDDLGGCGGLPMMETIGVSLCQRPPSPRERENPSPVFGENMRLNWPCGHFDERESSDGCSLSLGERVRVRASVIHFPLASLTDQKRQRTLNFVRPLRLVLSHTAGGVRGCVSSRPALSHCFIRCAAKVYQLSAAEGLGLVSPQRK